MDDLEVDGFSTRPNESIKLLLIHIASAPRACYQSLESDFNLILQPRSQHKLALDQAEIVLIELSKNQFSEDLNFLRKLRLQRSMVPLIAIGDYEDALKIEQMYIDRVNDYLHDSIDPVILRAKLHSFARYSKIAKLVEIQSNQLLDQSKRLKSAFDEIEKLKKVTTGN